MFVKNVYSIIALFPPKNKMRNTEFAPFNCETADRLQIRQPRSRKQAKKWHKWHDVKTFS